MLGEMMLWKILADAVVALHLFIMVFFAVSAALFALGIFKGRRNWQIFYWGVIVLAVGLRVGDWTGLLKSCSLSDLEFMLRRMYDPSESWMREGSLLNAVIYNIAGIQVPEFVFTILWGITAVVIVSSLVLRRK